MGVPTEPVSLSPEAVAELLRKLSDFRHDVNNHLTLVATAVELMHRKPDSVERMLETMADQPERIRDEVARFSGEIEAALRVTPD